ncbi:MAG: hypothetical protein DWP94_13470 [Flavobacterium sp.]|nr:MAG: hypothetical protein DWP94_13470 [Flavobacterium sp.]
MSRKKFLIPIAIITLGFIPVLFGILFKILHWSLGSITPGSLLAVGTIVMAIGVFILFLLLVLEILKK